MLVGDGSWLFVGNGSCLFVGDGSWLFVGSLWHLAPKKIGEDKFKSWELPPTAAPDVGYPTMVDEDRSVPATLHH